MSNLIKLKQIDGGRVLQNTVGTHETEITALQGLVGETSVQAQIAAAKPEVYQVTNDSTDIAVLSAGITAKAGDILIATSSTGVKSAYHYDAEAGWIACDGNVDASTVILSKDITLAGNYTQVGNITKSGTTGTLTAKGKSVETLITEMLSKREQPSITGNPTVSLTFSQAKAYEVGTSVTPSYSASLSAGSYTYGPDTGITAKTWSVVDSDGNTSDKASDSFPAFTVGDDEYYSITATANYDAGAVAEDNLGDPSSPTVQIGAGSDNKTKGHITGYRSWFIYIGTDNASAIDSAFIRDKATNKGSALSASGATYTIPAGTKRVMIALPAAGKVGRNTYSKKLTACIDVDGMGLDQYAAGKFAETTVAVEGANSYTATNYTVYTLENANGLAATSYTLTIK